MLTSLPRSSRRPSHFYSFCSTLGVTARYRHLLEDVRCLVPHHKRESKLDSGSDGMARAVNDICEIRCVKILKGDHLVLVTGESFVVRVPNNAHFLLCSPPLLTLPGAAIHIYS